MGNKNIQQIRIVILAIVAGITILFSLLASIQTWAQTPTPEPTEEWQGWCLGPKLQPDWYVVKGSDGNWWSGGLATYEPITGTMIGYVSAYSTTGLQPTSETCAIGWGDRWGGGTNPHALWELDQLQGDVEGRVCGFPIGAPGDETQWTAFCSAEGFPYYGTAGVQGPFVTDTVLLTEYYAGFDRQCAMEFQGYMRPIYESAGCEPEPTPTPIACEWEHVMSELNDWQETGLTNQLIVGCTTGIDGLRVFASSLTTLDFYQAGQIIQCPAQSWCDIPAELDGEIFWCLSGCSGALIEAKCNPPCDRNPPWAEDPPDFDDPPGIDIGDPVAGCLAQAHINAFVLTDTMVATVLGTFGISLPDWGWQESDWAVCYEAREILELEIGGIDFLPMANVMLVLLVLITLGIVIRR
jgi:hypothetical protein